MSASSKDDDDEIAEILDMGGRGLERRRAYVRARLMKTLQDAR